MRENCLLMYFEKSTVLIRKVLNVEKKRTTDINQVKSNRCSKYITLIFQFKNSQNISKNDCVLEGRFLFIQTDIDSLWLFPLGAFEVYFGSNTTMFPYKAEINSDKCFSEFSF